MSVKPVLIYDGRCSFCRLWLNYMQALVGDRVEWIASQDIGDRFPELPREGFKTGAVLVQSDGRILKGAAAIFGVLAISPAHRGWQTLHNHVTPFRWASNALYAQVAQHRSAAFHFTRILFGPAIRPLSYELTGSLFLRLLGLVFLFAFWSLAGQILGLAGSHGLMPVAQILPKLRGSIGSHAFLLVPSVFWLNASDAWLTWGVRLGILASLLLVFAGRFDHLFQRALLLICYLLYLSLVSIGQPFTLFQWDALLLETAFLGLFAGTPLIVWAFRLLLFRLMFESGCVKLLSGDPNWRNLHALRYHFMTQPLPNPLAWYMHHAPGWLLDSLTLLTFVIELGAPWLLFMPRRARQAGAALLIALQVVILLTGNYAFFNWLSIVLCLWAFDDGNLKRIAGIIGAASLTIKSTVRSQLLSGIVALLMLLGVIQVVSLFAPSVSAPFTSLSALLAPGQIVNSYGLFAIMTTTRPELVYEGSDDGQTWKEYAFPYKPGDMNRPLPLIAPFQPRLDWQLWFAALDGNYQEDRWTGNLLITLLQGNPDVMRLLEKPPFAHPPKFVRVSLYEYWFTTPEERRRTGAIWNRRYARPYLPSISLDALRH